MALNFRKLDQFKRITTVRFLSTPSKERPESNVYGRTTIQETDGLPTNFTNISIANTAETCNVFFSVSHTVISNRSYCFCASLGKKKHHSHTHPRLIQWKSSARSFTSNGVSFHNNVQIPNYLYRSGRVTTFSKTLEKKN